MDARETFEFDDDEEYILMKSLAMYAAHEREITLRQLVGDESDAAKIQRRASKAESMARQMFERVNDMKWEEASAEFHSIHGRPMDLNDVSDYDWFIHRTEGREQR